MLATIAQPTRRHFPKKEPDMITHDAATNTWSFTHGQQTYRGYASREQAAEAQYDVEHGKSIHSPLFLDLKAWIDAKLDEEEREEQRTGAELPFGALSDGTPIMGVYDKDEPGGRAGIVHAAVDSFWLSAQDEPNLFTLQGNGFQLCDLTIEQINTLRTLLIADIPEQLLAAAVAHSRGDAEPPTFALPAAPDAGSRDRIRMVETYVAAVLRNGKPTPEGIKVMARQIVVICTPDEDDLPVIRFEQWQGEDGPIYNDFVAGDGLTKVLIGTYGDDKAGVELIIGGTGINDKVEDVITLADVCQLRDNLTAILSDARLAEVLDPVVA
jgi:hypothetical protein